jgi:hypothetical protein
MPCIIAHVNPEGQNIIESWTKVQMENRTAKMFVRTGRQLETESSESIGLANDEALGSFPPDVLGKIMPKWSMIFRSLNELQECRR